MPTPLDDRPYWKPRDLASLLQTSPSHVYRLIERGELEHRRVGARAIRIPASAVAQLLAPDEPGTHASDDAKDLRPQAARFVERTGLTPELFAEAWRRGQIDDTSRNAHDAMEALALREALRSRLAMTP